MVLRPYGRNNGNKELDELAENAKVFLNGQEITGVTLADTTAGFILHDVYHNGRLVIEDGDIKEIGMMGNVQIMDNRTGKYVE